MLLGIAPGDGAYVDHTGAVFHPQDENGNGNIAFYEIQNTGDVIEIDIANQISGLATPTVTFYTQWGATDFDIVDRVDGSVIVSEQSGFDNDLWFVDVTGTSGTLQITQFDTNAGVDGTEAAWLAYIGVGDAQV